MERRAWAERFYNHYFPNLEPAENGECMAKCPFHEDAVESLSINLEKGLYYCHACGKGGDEYKFYQEKNDLLNEGFPAIVRAVTDKFGRRPEQQEPAERAGSAEEENLAPIPEEIVIRYHKTLMNIPEHLNWLATKRGIHKDTVEAFKLGYDLQTERITIPIYNSQGQCVNIRKYSGSAKGTSKMLSYQVGYGMARLFPVQNLLKDNLLLCEGEMDCILAIQLGYNAITTTGGANTWKKQWTQQFTDKKVNICYDIDTAGIAGAEAIAQDLIDVARVVKIIKLPITDPPNGDITDYFVSLGFSKEDLDRHIESTKQFFSTEPQPKRNKAGEIHEVHLSQASEAEYINKNIHMDVVVCGKDTAPFGYPKVISVQCNPSKRICSYCRVGREGGYCKQEVDMERVILNLIRCTDAQQDAALKTFMGIPKACSSYDLTIEETGGMEEIILQPELDTSSTDKPYTTRVAYYMGHGIRSNSSYHMEGMTITDPKSQYVTHLIREATPSRDNVSQFEMSPEMYEKLRIFNPLEGQTVEQKFDDIANDLSYNITKIYGRKDLIIGVDLVYHSALAFIFQGQLVDRGWVEALILGDTRTGKSETVLRLSEHYKAGEFITGENTSFAGLIGGMQQNQKRWYVSWGKIPLNDRRLVIIDEASGLTVSQIENMSGVRSSGIAEITKIHQERTHARTRLIWISNTRTGRSLNSYPYGVEAVKQLMGKNEDIARLELVITCASEEVPLSIINCEVVDREEVPHTYNSQLCKQLVLWSWSRRADQISFTDEAVTLILQQANEMAETYTSDFPLVEGANHRIKIARLAIATAARMFSSDENGDKIVVREEHVAFACKFLIDSYQKVSFGYAELSKQQLEQTRIALQAEEEVIQHLKDYPEVAKLLNDNAYMMLFTSLDVENFCNMDKEEVKVHLQFLYVRSMIQKEDRQFYAKTKNLIKILREGKWKHD